MTPRRKSPQTRIKDRERTKLWRESFKEIDPVGYLRWRRKKNRYARKNRRSNCAKYLWRNARSRSRKYGIKFSITPDHIHVPERCPVFDIPLYISNTGKFHWNSPSLDRINCKRGYIPSNIIVISWRANSIKRDATPKELQMLAEFYTKLEGNLCRRARRPSGKVLGGN